MKKIYLLIITVLCCLICFTSVTVNVSAIDTNDYDESYSETVELATESLILDDKIAELYEDSISVVDGKYIFEGDKLDENYDFINSNIEMVNALAEQNIVNVSEDKDVSLNIDEELFSEFGFSNLKLNWKGFDVTMDRSFMSVMGILCLLARYTNGSVAKTMMNSYSDVTEITNKMRNVAFTAENMVYNMSARSLNRASILLAPDGSLNSYAMGLVSTGVTAYVAFKIAMSVASFGVSTIITTVINFLVARLLPTYVDCFFMFFGGMCGWYSTCVWKTRWIFSFGTTVILS